MLSTSRSDERKLVEEASQILRSEGYEVAQDIVVSPTGGPGARVDLLGRGDSGLIIVEVKAGPSSAIDLLPLFQATVSLAREAPVRAVLITRSPLTESARRDAMHSSIEVIDADELRDRLPLVIHNQKARQSKIDNRLAPLVSEARVAVETELRSRKLRPAYFEVAHVPVGIHLWDPEELLRAAQQSVVRRTGWPIGVVLHREEARPRPRQTGVSAMIYSETLHRSLDYWRLEQNGAYYFARTFREDSPDIASSGKILWFDIRIWRIAESFEHARLLYETLGVEPTEQILFHIRHAGLKGRVLGASDPSRYFSFDREIAENEVTWTTETTPEQISSHLRELVKQACDKLFAMFDFFKLGDMVFDEVLGNYLKSRM